MKKVALRIREIDRDIFTAIKNGSKTVETRAASAKFRGLRVGDLLIFVCGKDRLEKTVKKTRTFASIDELFTNIDFRKIMPISQSIEEARTFWDDIPKYHQKIAKFGIIALELS